ncbi:MAG TPA: YetF domain-containing protein [Gaiellaceae bacterium]|jgi:uncharacterized membrane protein YcaP (DUF421 family)
MDIVIRAVIMYGFVLLVTRIVGRRELSSLEPLDLVLLVVIGDLVQQGVTQNDFSVTGLMLAVGTIAVLQAGVSWVGFRSRAAGLVLEGLPIVIIEDGKPLEQNLRRERLALSEVLESAREQGMARLDDIAWGILETSGKITFIKKGG